MPNNEPEKKRTVAKGKAAESRVITQETLRKFMHWRSMHSQNERINTDVTAALSKSKPQAIRVEMQSVQKRGGRAFNTWINPASPPRYQVGLDTPRLRSASTIKKTA